MKGLKSSTNQYRRVSYLCVGCKNRRSVIVDKTLHLDREELKINGLASYIDVHEDFEENGLGEHGVKLHIDSHFHVRSNDLLSEMTPEKQAKGISKSITGLPSPKVQIESKKLLYPSISWNSLELSSRQHNIGFYVINTEPTTNAEDNKITNLKSSLGTVIANINFRRSKLTPKQFENNKIWIEILLDWIESTASLNGKVIPSVLRYIDGQTENSPDVVDQLSIPILIDKSAKIRLQKDKQILEDIIGTTIQNPYNVGIFYPNQSVDYESFFLIKDKMSKKRFVKMASIVDSLIDDSSNQEKTMDTFVLFFFKMITNDSLEYQVSYLL